MKTHLLVTVAMVPLAAVMVGLLLVLVMPTD
jgi:hypothetical protein